MFVCLFGLVDTQFKLVGSLLLHNHVFPVLLTDVCTLKPGIDVRVFLYVIYILM